MAVPMPIGEHIGGFVLLGNKPGGFTDDDRRLARTLTLRAGAQLASAHAVALSRKESARYSLMNELVKEASGKTMKEVLDLVLDKGKQVIRYDAGSVALFQPDNTYVVLGGPGRLASDRRTARQGSRWRDRAAEPGHRRRGHLQRAHPEHRRRHHQRGADADPRQGRRVRRHLPRPQRHHGIQPARHRRARRAGVDGRRRCRELAHPVRCVTGQASKLDTTLDALGEVSQALTTVTQGSKVLEQKTLETAVRVTTASAGLLTRTTADGSQATIMSLGLPSTVDELVVQNGQGIIGAVMLSGQPDGGARPQPEPGASVAARPRQVRAARGDLHADARGRAPVGNAVGLRRQEARMDHRRSARAGDPRQPGRGRGAGTPSCTTTTSAASGSCRNLQEALQAATSTLDLNQVLQQVLAGAAKASSAQIGCLALDDSGKLVLKGGFGTDSTTAEKLALGVGGDICRDVMASGKPFMEAMEQDTINDSPLNPRAVLCVPITLRGKPTGVLFLANYQVGHAFTPDHRNLVTELAAQAAVAIDNARLFKDREEVILSSLEALANAVDARDPYTAGHSQRVTRVRADDRAPDEVLAEGPGSVGCGSSAAAGCTTSGRSACPTPSCRRRASSPTRSSRR